MAKYHEVDLFRRTSHRYRAGWSYLDSDDHVCGATIIEREGGEEDTEDGYTYYRGRATIILERSVPYSIACDAIRDSFRVNNCRHEHDCCGCLHIGVGDITVLDTDIYEFELHGSRNY